MAQRNKASNIPAENKGDSSEMKPTSSANNAAVSFMSHIIIPGANPAAFEIFLYTVQITFQ